MNSMGKLGYSIKTVKIVMMMALLFCIFFCPHSADAIQDECSTSEPAVACQNLCDCSSSSHQDEYCLESFIYDFRGDTSLTVYWNFDHVDWAHSVLSLDEPKHPICYSDIVARFSSHSFAVRHLDTIILRVWSSFHNIFYNVDRCGGVVLSIFPASGEYS